MKMEVCGEKLVRVKCVLVLAHDDYISFKKSVGLMARQKKSKGGVAHLDRIAFSHLPGVTEFRVIRVRHFTQMEECKEACE